MDLEINGSRTMISYDTFSRLPSGVVFLDHVLSNQDSSEEDTFQVCYCLYNIYIILRLQKVLILLIPKLSF